jgi:hypothetical protein
MAVTYYGGIVIEALSTDTWPDSPGCVQETMIRKR